MVIPPTPGGTRQRFAGGQKQHTPFRPRVHGGKLNVARSRLQGVTRCHLFKERSRNAQIRSDRIAYARGRRTSVSLTSKTLTSGPAARSRFWGRISARGESSGVDFRWMSTLKASNRGGAMERRIADPSDCAVLGQQGCEPVSVRCTSYTFLPSGTGDYGKPSFSVSESEFRLAPCICGRRMCA
jgi:hypothetical protein